MNEEMRPKMAEQNETWADIVASLRSEPLFNPHNSTELTEANNTLKIFADRLVAAVNRELQAAHDDILQLCKEKQEIHEAYLELKTGNAVSLREALEEIASAAQWGGSDFGNHVIAALLQQLDVIRATAKAALSAPPRNCDRFATKDEAWDAFAHAYFGATDPGFIEDAFERWLFATAQEGGDHAAS